LCTKHRCFVGTDRRGLEGVKGYEGLNCCVAHSQGNEDYVALGCGDGKVYLHRLDNGEVVGVLQEEEGAKRITTIAVSKASSSNEVIDSTEATWLVVGDDECVIRTWDVETWAAYHDWMRARTTLKRYRPLKKSRLRGTEGAS
jgi:WD40 repeat protein